MNSMHKICPSPPGVNFSIPFSIYYGDQPNIIQPSQDEVVTKTQMFETFLGFNSLAIPAKRDQLEYEIK